MSIASYFWQKICQPLDGFLWHRDISHPIIRPLLRNVILACGFCILAGAALYAIFPWLFWFGIGMLCICWIFWSWARFFLRTPLAGFNISIAGIMLRFAFRLAVLAVLLYFALAICAAPPMAIVAGLVAGAVLALASYAYYLGFGAG